MYLLDIICDLHGNGVKKSTTGTDRKRSSVSNLSKSVTFPKEYQNYFRYKSGSYHVNGQCKNNVFSQCTGRYIGILN